MSRIRFTASPYAIGTWTVLRLPKAASAKLPSRGMAMVTGTMNGEDIATVLEPDGKGSHWLRIDKNLGKTTGARVGEEATLEIEPTKDWPEPPVPADIKSALAADPKARAVWDDVTPMARWDWIRWIRATNNADTRRKRIDVARSKLKSGMRRPCCFNRSMCTEPAVSKGGVLVEGE
jgi:hypothetical protein